MAKQTSLGPRWRGSSHIAEYTDGGSSCCEFGGTDSAWGVQLNRGF